MTKTLRERAEEASEAFSSYVEARGVRIGYEAGFLDGAKLAWEAAREREFRPSEDGLHMYKGDKYHDFDDWLKEITEG